MDRAKYNRIMKAYIKANKERDGAQRRFNYMTERAKELGRQLDEMEREG